jgi:hypothetical protein
LKRGEREKVVRTELNTLFNSSEEAYAAKNDVRMLICTLYFTCTSYMYMIHYRSVLPLTSLLNHNPDQKLITWIKQCVTPWYSPYLPMSVALQVWSSKCIFKDIAPSSNQWERDPGHQGSSTSERINLVVWGDRSIMCIEQNKTLKKRCPYDSALICQTNFNDSCF